MGKEMYLTVSSERRKRRKGRFLPFLLITWAPSNLMNTTLINLIYLINLFCFPSYLIPEGCFASTTIFQDYRFDNVCEHHSY